MLVKVHLWFGLSLGVLFVMTGLTGSLLVFYQQIDVLLNPVLNDEESGARPASYEALYRALADEWPESEGYWSIEIPKDGGTITSRFYRDAAPSRPAERRIVSVDPETFAILRDVPWGGYAMTWIYDLHQQLLLSPATGKKIMGILGLLVLGFLGTGIAIWWPRQGRWRRALLFSRAAPWPRRLLEIHQLTGVYGGALLIVLAATGTMICLPAQVRSALSAVSSIERFPAVHSQSAPGAARISLDRALHTAETRFPEARAVWINVPNTAKGVFEIRMQQSGEPSPRFPRTYVWIDQYSGQVLAVHDTRKESAGDAVLTWLHPLHAGEAFGLPGRLVVFVLGLLPLVLFVTGLTRWLQRRTSAVPGSLAADQTLDRAAGPTTQ